jgi:hypothetical protein
MWAQQWNNIYDIVRPYKDKSSIDVTPTLVQKVSIFMVICLYCVCTIVKHVCVLRGINHYHIAVVTAKVLVVIVVSLHSFAHDTITVCWSSEFYSQTNVWDSRRVLPVNRTVPDDRQLLGEFHHWKTGRRPNARVPCFRLGFPQRERLPVCVGVCLDFRYVLVYVWTSGMCWCMSELPVCLSVCLDVRYVSLYVWVLFGGY